jgi:hypothetical protein
MGYPVSWFLAGSSIVILPIVFGWVCARTRAARSIILVLGLAALALTLLGVYFFTTGEALGAADSQMQGLGVVLTGFACTLVGLMSGFAVCGCAVAHAQRSGRQQWYVGLLLTNVLPLLATVGLFDLLFLVVMARDPGDPATTVPVALIFGLAPVGCVAPLIYGMIALHRPRE